MNREKTCHWIKSVKSYKEDPVFLVAKTLKDIRNWCFKKEFSQQPILFKATASFYSNASQYSGAIKTCKKFSSPTKEHRQKTFVTFSRL